MAWALSRSKVVSDLIAAPGNPGIGQLASCTDVSATDPEALLELAGHIKAELVVIGPEAPLIAGVGDDLRQAGLKVFGPSARAARLEGSKLTGERVVEADAPHGSVGALDAGHGLSGHALAAAHEAHALVGRELDVHARGIEPRGGS